MNSVSESDCGSLFEQLSGAVAAGDWGVADEIVEGLGRSIPQEMLEVVAEVCMQGGRWKEARRLLNRVLEPTVVTGQLKCLVGNMIGAEKYQPRLYAVLMKEEGEAPSYAVGYTSDGYPTVVYLDGKGGQMVMSEKGHPLKGLESVLPSLVKPVDDCEPIGLLGVGDGYLLNHLVANQPEMFLGRQRPVYLFEPSVDAVKAVMRIHNMSGEGGALGADYVNWYVGEACFDSLVEDVRKDYLMQVPSKACVMQSKDVALFKGWYDDMLERAYQGGGQIYDESVAYYEGLDDAHFLKALRGELDRKPRVLIPTSRFSTVLKYVAEDLKVAFEELGWEVKVLMELKDTHLVSVLSLRHGTREFKPDLVFQIDHLRLECPETYPENLPFVCWVQDFLANIICPEAGPSVGRRDFYLAGGMGLSKNHGYPTRQYIHMRKATSGVLKGGEDRLEDVPDIAMVSNCSKQVGEMVEDLMGQFSELMQPMVRDCCKEMVGVYEAGGSLSLTAEAIEIVKVQSQKHRLHFGTEEAMRQVAIYLWHPLNDTLYRQQALRWIVGAAERLGLSLGLYGNGWEDHPEFAKYARGYINYGADLEELTRRSQINLHIVPFSCMHQRLLDGVMAGGFFLIRDHRKNHPAYDLLRFVEDHCAAGTVSYTDACEGLDEALRRRLDELVEIQRLVYPEGDVVNHVMEHRAQHPERIVPCYDEVMFRDEGEIGKLLERFVEAEGLRRSIVQEQRAFVHERFTYAGQLPRVLGRIAELISTEEGGE